MTIDPATGDDLAVIMELERSGFQPVERWSKTAWRDELTGPGRIVLIAHPDLGVITLRVTGEIADLHRIVVAADHRRTGIGRRLLDAGIEAVRAAGVRSILAEVRYDNEAAIELYQRAGFEQLGARTDYYGPGRHALILKRYDLDLGSSRTEQTPSSRTEPSTTSRAEPSTTSRAEPTTTSRTEPTTTSRTELVEVPSPMKPSGSPGPSTRSGNEKRS